MALNMFSIEETKLRSGSSSATTPTTYRSVAQVTIITIRVSAEYFFSISILIFDNLHTYSHFKFSVRNVRANLCLLLPRAKCY